MEGYGFSYIIYVIILGGSMKKRIVLFLFALFFVVSGLCAQQLTRFALVDLPKVYQAFFRDYRAVREFEQKSARVQAEIDKITKEIQDLKSRQLDAVQRGDQSEALRLETQVNRRTEFLREYFTTKTAELENDKRRLMQSGSFLDQVYDEIRIIAESEGYTAIFDVKETKGLVWHSPALDITDRLIQNLQNKSR